MNQEQRGMLGRELSALASYYSKELKIETARMMIDDLADLDLQDVQKALMTYRRDSKNRFFPLPAQIRDLVNPEASDHSNSVSAASKIIEAITRWGWSNQSEARDHIGPLGWTAVERSGGWSYLCENMGVTIQPTTFIAQARDMLKAEAEIQKVVGFRGPELGAPEKRPELDRRKAAETFNPPHGLQKLEDVLSIIGQKPPGF